MTAVLAPLLFDQFLNQTGTAVAVGYKVFSYQSGTTIKQPTYTDSAQATANPNPIILDSVGNAGTGIWLDPALIYKFVFAPANDTDPPTSALWTRDNVYPPLTPVTLLQILTQQVLGAIIYPRTTAETTAGVTPTFYIYPPGDIRRYGAIADAAVNGTTGTDNSAAINTALSVTGQAAYATSGNFGFKNMLIPGGATLVGAGIHETNFISLTGAIGTMATDTGSAAKVNISGVAFYCNNCAYTAGFKLGYNTTAYGTEGYLDQIWVRDLPTGFPGIDINGNVGEGGFLIVQNTGGIRIIGTANMFDKLENPQSSGFVNTGGVTSTTEFGDGSINAMEIEAPQNNAVSYYLTGNTSIDNLTISFSAGYVGDHIIEIGASATTWRIGNLKYYFKTGTAWSGATAYVIGNLVTLAGLTYYCILGNTNQTPPNATYWRLSPSITSGNIKSGTQFFGGNVTGNNFSGQANYADSAFLAGGTFAVKLQQMQSFKIRVINTAGTIQHRMGNAGDSSQTSNFLGQVNAASQTLTNTPTGADGSTAFATGAKIGSASTSVLWLDTAAITAADSLFLCTVVANSTTTAYGLLPFVTNININGVTQNRLGLQLVNPTTAAAVAWATALGTPTWFIDIGFLGFIR